MKKSESEIGKSTTDSIPLRLQKRIEELAIKHQGPSTSFRKWDSCNDCMKLIAQELWSDYMQAIEALELSVQADAGKMHYGDFVEMRNSFLDRHREKWGSDER